MKILVTGAAGFIGFHLCEKLLEEKHQILGIDNINNYYSPSIKYKRLKILKRSKKFNFIKLDIKNKKKLNLIFKQKINATFHFAAQAGVRYSLKNPRSYVENNILGFYNILESSIENKVKKIFYASSSSVYGDSKKFPLKENNIIKPKNIYALTKKTNEEISELAVKNKKISIIGLRFFTVFGEWGRPDMFIMKYMNAYRQKKTFYLNNYGNHLRDFTYIKDVIKIMEKILDKRKKIKNFEIFNICSNKPINLQRVIKFMNKNKIKPKIKKVGLQKADIYKTHGNNKKIIKITKFNKFTNLEKGLVNTLDWYKKFYKFN